MKQKDIERVMEAAYKVCGPHMSLPELSRDLGEFGEVLRHADPHGVYKRGTLAQNAANAQTSEAWDLSLQSSPRIEPWPPRMIRDSTNGDF
jgi:hypothetical protein